MNKLRGSGGLSFAKRAIVALLLPMFVLVNASPAFASTTGTVSGTVTDAQTHAPIANVRVTAAAATGSYSATTNNSGFYSMTGVFSDTYVVSFSAGGYEPASIPGVTVAADQTQTVNQALTKRLKEIYHVTARAAGGAFQPSQTTDTYTVTAKQAQQVLGNNVNLSESQLIASLPGAMLDSSGYPVIRGGRENEESFQFEGIPYTDAFTNQFVNTLSLPGLGLQNAQLTPGVGDASQENAGTGTLNLVVKRGSYPAFANVELAAGMPSFRHSLNAEYGFATPDGRISNYMTFAGRNFAPTYVNSDASVNRFYKLGLESDREFVNNLVFRFGNQNRQSLQFFADLADHHFLYNDASGLVPFASADPYYRRYAGLYSGLFYGAPLSNQQVGNLTTLDPYQTNQDELLAQAHANPYAYYQPNASFKLQYTNNLNSSTFLSLMAYKTNAVVQFAFPEDGVGPFNFNAELQQGGQTMGTKLDITKQLGDKNLLKAGASFAYLHPTYDQPWTKYGVFNTIFSGNAEYLDFLPADANCPTGNPGDCGYLARNGIPAGTRIPPSYENAISNRLDSSIYVNDTFTPNDKLKIDAGLRLDKTVIHASLPSMGINPATCEYYLPPVSYTPPVDASGNPTTAVPGNCGSATFNTGAQYFQPTVAQPVIAVSYKLGAHDAVRASYGRSVEFPTLGLMDLWGGEQYYTAKYGKIPSYSAANGGGPATTCGLNANTLCLNYGEQLFWDNQNDVFGAPFQPAKPEEFNNYDFSYSHEFTQGILNGVQFKVTPYLRRSQDALASSAVPLIINGKAVVDANGNPQYAPPVVTNNGFNQAAGAELQITRQVPVGFSPQFTATYINEVSNVVPLSGSEDFYPSIPAPSLALKNVYRVGFLSPFQTTLSLDYTTKSGWRIDPVFRYNIGYPEGAGLNGAAFVDGKPYGIPNTNYSAGLIGSPAGATQYVDPMNPGSVFSPNIAATRGTKEASSPGGVLSHPNTVADLTVEYNTPRNITFGATVLNVFNEIYGGPSLNGRYQPVATGISGPKSGTSSLTYAPYAGPGLGFTNYTNLRQPFQPYINTPNGAGRTFYFYIKTKI